MLNKPTLEQVFLKSVSSVVNEMWILTCMLVIDYFDLVVALALVNM